MFVRAAAPALLQFNALEVGDASLDVAGPLGRPTNIVTRAIDQYLQTKHR